MSKRITVKWRTVYSSQSPSFLAYILSLGEIELINQPTHKKKGDGYNQAISEQYNLIKKYLTWMRIVFSIFNVCVSSTQNL